MWYYYHIGCTYTCIMQILMRTNVMRVHINIAVDKNFSQQEQEVKFGKVSSGKYYYFQLYSSSFCKLIFALMAMIKDLICATSDMEGAHTFMQNACIIMYNNMSLKEES